MKTILITGASSGIGEATAKHFQANGWNVVASMRNPDNAAELAELDNVHVARLDVTDPGSIAEAQHQVLAETLSNPLPRDLAQFQATQSRQADLRTRIQGLPHG